ncbi:unnamed protein product [Nesidiocoris tenuis]|uniref:Uncharacterized protein n=1 Tax=Nesidiocoris tenuis TaxID=355587 RepID=A0A6H5FXG8_9HEMI|nr:unnamed protein product [Nesidiocoris tenuis]
MFKSIEKLALHYRRLQGNLPFKYYPILLRIEGPIVLDIVPDVPQQVYHGILKHQLRWLNVLRENIEGTDAPVSYKAKGITIKIGKADHRNTGKLFLLIFVISCSSVSGGVGVLPTRRSGGHLKVTHFSLLPFVKVTFLFLRDFPSRRCFNGLKVPFGPERTRDKIENACGSTRPRHLYRVSTFMLAITTIEKSVL